ncbi:hypothetical protein AR457_39090 [Streptomyces agglomeratus]|uniref:hypothetical protein n=1 Tax=Streptomyces agglomeratus TaxID=285458 RepID=UPI00085411A8|nr:hypothetical protein [Streptomyces agglomeratus]OEJ21937.1 hypothetical protein AR457_39090 [Streptomyces agglomeratus]
MGVQRDGAKDYLYYASDWIWPDHRLDFVKSLLLFFDGVALSLPEELANETIERSPELAQPLKEKGLLVNLDPHTHLGPDAAASLAQWLTDWLSGPTSLSASPSLHGVGLTHAHWGAARGARHRAEAEVFTQLMVRRGLASAEGEGLWKLHPEVRLMVLVAYCRFLHREIQNTADFTLQPVLVDPYGSRPLQSEESFQSASSGPDRARRTWLSIQRTLRVVCSDWNEVGVDLSRIPLDEVLDFRDHHGTQFRSYAKGLRDLLTITEGLTDAQFEAELRARAARITDDAADLRTTLRRAFGRTTAGAVLAIAGAAWTATQGDIVGALVTTAAASAAIAPPPRQVTAYSYLLSIKRSL